MPENFYEVYNLLIRDKNYPDFLVCEKVEFETQENPGLVEFNYQTVMRYEDDSNMEVIGFFHTHPDHCPHMSQTDINTMKAWVACFGRPLLCVIGCKMSPWIYSRGKIIERIKLDTSGWWCWKNIAIPVKVAEFDPNRFIFHEQQNVRHSHIIVSKSHEKITFF